MYAETTQLGWDPTMERVSPRHHIGQVEYIIKCCDVKYRTVRLISDIGAEAIRGRGTRVWEVRRVRGEDTPDDPTPLVLKDSWVDADREPEGKILASIRKAVKKLPDMDDTDDFFMEAKDYGDVYIGNDIDHTHKLIRKRSFLDGADPKPLVIKAKTPVPAKGRPIPSNATGVTGAPQLPADGSRELVKYSAKVHHRIVFTEVGKTIAEVESLADAVVAMLDVVRGEHAAFPDVPPSLTRVCSPRCLTSMRMGPPRHQCR